jgi:hypothetical protein
LDATTADDERRTTSDDDPLSRPAPAGFLALSCRESVLSRPPAPPAAAAAAAAAAPAAPPPRRPRGSSLSPARAAGQKGLRRDFYEDLSMMKMPTVVPASRGAATAHAESAGARPLDQVGSVGLGSRALIILNARPNSLPSRRPAADSAIGVPG